MQNSWVTNLGMGPDVWLFLTILTCLTLFFRFGRFWSVRNLDLILIFALAPGMMLLTGTDSTDAWLAYLWLFVGSLAWMIRCLIDLGLSRRPLMEPNLNASGLACLMVGIVILLVVEMINRPATHFDAAGSTEPGVMHPQDQPSGELYFERALEVAPVTLTLFADEKPRLILRRVIALAGQLGLVVGLTIVGWRQFDRPIAGLSAATCYLLLPYSRFALTDCSQLVPSALIVVAVANHQRPIVAGLLLGIAATWNPACIGLLPLWAGYYRGRRMARFVVGSAVVLGSCVGIVAALPGLRSWFRVVGIRNWTEAGVWPGTPAPLELGFWSGIDAAYRLPVQVAYLILVIVLAILPFHKNLGELISLSAALLSASQFWYLEAGGTQILLYLPLVILMMFRPNLAFRQGFTRSGRALTSLVHT